jgi:hypothetical protein
MSPRVTPIDLLGKRIRDERRIGNEQLSQRPEAARRSFAAARSFVACKFIHSRADVRSAPARSSAASAVIDDRNVQCSAALEAEYQTPLVIDADRIVAFPSTIERLQPITPWYSKVPNFGSLMQIQKLASRRRQEFNGKRSRPFGTAVVKYAFG